MNIWLKRLIYLTLTSIWLAGMLFPLAAVRLARRGEFNVGNTRVFLLQERRMGGVGFQSTREVTREAPCTQTRIRFVMWDGEATPSSSCICDDGVEREPIRRSCVAPLSSADG